MLSTEQIKKLVSAKDSLQIQLEDANAILAAREQEIGFLHSQLAEATAIRSKMDAQQDEIEKFQYLLYKKDQQAVGAVERETELQQELTELASLNNRYNELLKDHSSLSSRFADMQSQLTAVNARNFELEQVVARAAELESILENGKIEREGLENRITTLESRKYLGGFDV